MGETKEDRVAEEEQKRQVEAQLHDKWATEQMAWAAQAESSKQVTQNFA